MHKRRRSVLKRLLGQHRSLSVAGLPAVIIINPWLDLLRRDGAKQEGAEPCRHAIEREEYGGAMAFSVRRQPEDLV